MAKKRTAAQEAADRLRTGRPPKAAAQKQSESVTVYMTVAERRRLEKMASRDGLTLSAVIMRPWREGN